jgi:hypothetical protein
MRLWSRSRSHPGRIGTPLGPVRSTSLEAIFQVRALQQLIEWALPIQERHFDDVKAGSLKLAAEEDPAEAA